MTHPDGWEINHDYGTTGAIDDVMSRLASIKDDDDSTVLASYRYLGAGRIVTEDYEEIQVNLDYAGDTNTFSALDRFGRVTDQVWNDYGEDPDVVRDRYTYTYDRVGNRMSRDNELDSDFDEDYTYDSLNRLTDFDRGDGFDQSWNDLDALGNWSTFDNDGTSQTREVNEANEIEKIDGSPNDVAYDAAGNMIEVPKLDGSGEHFCLKYDAWNRLAAVYDDNGTTLIAKYEYDAAGRRIEKETYSGGSLDEARHYYYGGTWQCIEERVEASGVLPGDADVQYVWGAKYVDDLILRDRDTDADGTMDERLYALADANYNVTALFDEATGTVVERFVYDAYGNVTELDPDDFTAYTGSDYEWEYTYTTRREDAETGLMYYRARYYDAELGRFVSRDPSQHPGRDGNLYRYTFNDPIARVDPSGLKDLPPGMTQEEVDATIKLAKGKIKLWLLAGKTMTAKRLLQHFYDGSGKAIALTQSDIAMILRTREARNGLHKAEFEFMAALRDGKVNSGESYITETKIIEYTRPSCWEKRIFDPDRYDCFYSFHRLKVRVCYTGVIHFENGTKVWKGCVNYHFFDHYIFSDRDQSAFPDDPEATPTGYSGYCKNTVRLRLLGLAGLTSTMNGQ